jgi:hypothetical protein
MVGVLSVWHALTWEYKFGNVTFLMLWLWTVAATSMIPWRQALGYALLIALKPFWLILLAPWLLARRTTLFLRVGVLLLGLSLLPAIFGVHSLELAYSRWFATFADPMHAHNYPKGDNQSWYAVLFRHREALGGSVPLLWLAGSTAVGLLWLWPWRRLLRHRLAPEAVWQLELTVLPVMLWAAPLSWIHHQILLWPLLALLWQRGREVPSSRVAWAAAWLLMNGTDQLFLGRTLSVQVYQWGLPILAYPVLALWGSLGSASSLAPGERGAGPATAPPGLTPSASG